MHYLFLLRFAEAVNDLKICRVTRVSGTVLGGDEVTILCEKVQKGKVNVFNWSTLCYSTVISFFRY